MGTHRFDPIQLYGNASIKFHRHHPIALVHFKVDAQSPVEVIIVSLPGNIFLSPIRGGSADGGRPPLDGRHPGGSVGAFSNPTTAERNACDNDAKSLPARKYYWEDK
jgi:hypothetical protein